MKKYLQIVSCIILVVMLFNFVSCDTPPQEDEETYTAAYGYILNTNSKKIHKKSCGTAALISTKNRKEYYGELSDLYKKGYTTCGNCFR